METSFLMESKKPAPNSRIRARGGLNPMWEDKLTDQRFPGACVCPPRPSWSQGGDLSRGISYSIFIPPTFTFDRYMYLIIWLQTFTVTSKVNGFSVCHW